jgi:Transketolase, C-terminal domain
VRVIDCYSIKPIDADALRAAARQTAVIVTVEDHWAEGGLGEAVLSALADQPQRPPILRLGARDIPDRPRSGQSAGLLHAAGIDAAAIVGAVRTHLAPGSADATTSAVVRAETAAAHGVLVRLNPIAPESALSSKLAERERRRPTYGWPQPHQRREQGRRGHCRGHQPAHRHELSGGSK